jgi:hypothetical protein
MNFIHTNNIYSAAKVSIISGFGGFSLPDLANIHFLIWRLCREELRRERKKAICAA